MTNNNSLTLFDQLATEIIFEIFDYLSSNDIISTFFYFNQRFNSILLQHQRFLYNLKSPTTNFYFWENVLPIIGSQIQCLTINTIDFCFLLKLFPNLKSLIIDSPFSIDHNQLNSIFYSEQFNKLNSFKIKSQIYYEKFQKTFFKNIFHNESSLEIFECLSILHSFYFEGINNLTINKNIRSLSLKLYNLDKFDSLLEYTPNLKDLNLIVKTRAFNNHKLIEEFKLSKIKLEKFYFTAEINLMSNTTTYEKYFIPLTHIIKQFSSTLIYLSINISQIYIEETDTFQFNGFTLQQQLLESMIQLKIFHLYTRLKQNLINLEDLLLTFKNPFWFDHNWSIGIHGNYLYTLPFYFDKLYKFIDFDHIESSNSKILNSSSTWYHVKSIDLCTFYGLNLNLIKQLKLKMPNLITIELYPMADQCFDTIQDSYIIDNEMNTTLDSITTVYYRGNYMKDIKEWLTYILPNFKTLILLNSKTLMFSHKSVFVPIVNEKIERLKIIDATSIDEWIITIDIYFPNLKHIEIELFGFYMPNNLMKILKNFKTLKTLMICCRESGYGYSYDHSETLDICERFNKLDLIEILEKYQIKRSYYSYQFIKKSDD